MPETFTPFTWADDEVGGTPITAAQLNRLETGVESMDDRVAALEASGGIPDGAVTNAQVATNAAITLDKTADSATRLAMTSAERTKLTGVATGATANSTDATLLARANHTGTQAVSTVTGLQTALDAKAPTTVPINAQTGTTYTFVLADAAQLVRAGNAGAQTYTIPPNSSVAFPVGTVLQIMRYGAGTLSVVQGSGVTLRPSSPQTARAQYSTITAIQVAANEWVIGGDAT